jgi:hypothetical protein
MAIVEQRCPQYIRIQNNSQQRGPYIVDEPIPGPLLSFYHHDTMQAVKRNFALDHMYKPTFFAL